MCYSNGDNARTTNNNTDVMGRNCNWDTRIHAAVPVRFDINQLNIIFLHILLFMRTQSECKKMFEQQMHRM